MNSIKAKPGRPRKDAPEGVDLWGTTVAQLAREWSVSTATVSRWRREAIEAGADPTSDMRGRKLRPMPEDANPWGGTLIEVAQRLGVSARVVARWRREHPELRSKPLGFVTTLETKRPGAVALCRSNAPSSAIAKAYGVTRQAVDQWRSKL